MLLLAVDRGVTVVIVDDLAAIRAARASGLEPRSTPYLLLDGHRQGRLGSSSFQARLDALLGHGYFMSPRLYQRLIEAARAK